MVANGQIDPLDKCRIDLPTAGRSDVLNRLEGPEPHAVPHPHQAPPAPDLDHLRLEELRPGQPAGLRRGTGGLAAWWLDPVAKVWQ
jgi:hypothetical protein